MASQSIRRRLLSLLYSIKNRHSARKDDDDDVRSKVHHRPMMSRGTLNYAIFICTMLALVILYKCTVFVFGDGYDRRGGLFGIWKDTRQQEKYQYEMNQFTSNLVFPSVQIRANRKTTIGKSRFLEEILRRNPSRSSSIEWNPKGNSLTKGESKSIDYKSYVVDVAGFETLLHVPHEKYSMAAELRKIGCKPGWSCHRCLASPYHGSFQKCSSKCPDCYLNFIKNSNDMPTNLSVTAQSIDDVLDEIPSILHQSWHSFVDGLHYPELSRIQNAWKSMVSQHRFYLYSEEQKYIELYFPAIISKVYDLIPSVANKHKFFRLLVLFKDGGIWADLDVLPETNIETIIHEPNVSFIAVRDNSLLGHCAWDGLIASKPGHPILAKAIETIMTSVLLFGSGDHLEFTVLSKNVKESELWRLGVNSNENNLYSGCGIGIAINEVLERSDPLINLKLGKHKMPGTSRGELNILMMSRDDTGASRCSDISRNILVSSTGMIGLNLLSMQDRSDQSYREETLDRYE